MAAAVAPLIPPAELVVLGRIRSRARRAIVRRRQPFARHQHRYNLASRRFTRLVYGWLAGLAAADLARLADAGRRLCERDASHWPTHERLDDLALAWVFLSSWAGAGGDPTHPDAGLVMDFGRLSPRQERRMAEAAYDRAYGSFVA